MARMLKLDVLDENNRAPKTEPSKPSSSARTQKVDSSERRIGARRSNSPRASSPRASSPRNLASKKDAKRSLTLDRRSSPRTSSPRASSPRTLVSKKGPTKSSTADQHSSSRSRTRRSLRSSSPRPASSRSRNCASPRSPRSTSRSASPRSEQSRRSPRSAKIPRSKDWVPASASGLSGGRRVKSADDERSFLAGSTANSCEKSPAVPKTKVYKDWIPASSRGLSGGRRVESSRDRRSYLAGSCDDLFASSSDQRVKSSPATPSSKLAKTKVYKDWIPASSRGLSGGRRVESSRDRRSYLAGSCDDLFASNSASRHRRVHSTPSSPTQKSSKNRLVNSWVPASASGFSGGRRVKSIDDERSFLGSMLNEDTKLLTPAKAKVYKDWIPASSRGFSGGRQADSSIDRRSYLAGVQHDEDLLDSSPRATRNAHNRRSRSKKASSGSQRRSRSQNSNGSKSRSPLRRQDWIPASSRGLSGGALSKSSPKVAEHLVAGHREGDGNVAAHRVSKLTANEKIKVAAERSQAAERRRIASDKAAEEEALLERRQRYKMIVAQGTLEGGTSCNKHDAKVISILSRKRDDRQKQEKEKPTESEGDAVAIKESKHEAKGTSLDGSFSTASPAQRLPSSSQPLVISSGSPTSESSSLPSSPSSSSPSLLSSSSSSSSSSSASSSLRQHYTNRSAGARPENAIAREQLALKAKELVAKSQSMRAKQRHAQQPPREQKVSDISSKDTSSSRIDSGSNPLDIKVPISQMMDAMSSLDLEATGQVTNMEMTSVVSEDQQRTREQLQKLPMQ